MVTASFLCTLLPLLLIVSLDVDALSFAGVRSAVHHLNSSPPTETVDSLANEAIPRRDGKSVLAYCAKPPPKKVNNGQEKAPPVLILIHEFFGLTRSICDKADALAQDLGCVVIAPDTFRGKSSTFIPKCIWLALSTPQDRVNQDLDDVVAWADAQPEEMMDASNIAVMGFCYGGGKAIRYTAERKPDAATVVCYGSPLTDVAMLSKLEKPVCGIFGSLDVQFPPPVLDSFRDALTEAKVDSDVRVYDGVGHAFWSDMAQVRRGDQPQADAYNQVTTFLKKQFYP